MARSSGAAAGASIASQPILIIAGFPRNMNTVRERFVVSD
jgi:hypothetical protein